DAVLFDRCHGREEIRAYVASLMEQGRAGPLPNGDVAYRHFAQAATIDAEAPDRASVHSYLLWVNMGKEPPVSAAAEYLATVVKPDGRWLFQTRRIRPLAGRVPGPDRVTAPAQ